MASKENTQQDNNQKSIVALGDGKVFVKRTPDGIIRAVQGVVQLDEKNGEFADIQGKFMTTAKGFNTLNQITGLSVITPEKLTLPEGNIVVNPFPFVDPETGSITKVWVKKVAIGYSPTGNLAVTSATLQYDIRMYFIQDLVKKVEICKDAGKICLKSSLSEEELKNGQFFAIDGELGVYVNFSHKDILKAINTYIQKKLFGERNAQSICERLVLGKHPALAHAAYVNATGTGPSKARTAKVPVIGFVHDLTREEMLNITEQAEKGQEIKIKGQQAETIDIGVTTATADEMETEIDDEEKIHNAVSDSGEQKGSEEAPSLFGGDQY